MPVLPGNPPLGGHILSHDQIEAAFMRRAGYEVRVIPVEEGSYEDNPPTLLDFTKRDLRWCQGNMQYWHLLSEPGLPALSRFQLVAAIFMYLSTAAWMTMVAAGAAIAVSGGFQSMHSDLALILYFTMIGLSMAPKFVGYLDVAMTQGGAARYGGRLRLVAGALAETLFSLLLIPITALRLTIFMTSLVFGRAIIWSGQRATFTVSPGARRRRGCFRNFSPGPRSSPSSWPARPERSPGPRRCCAASCSLCPSRC